MTDVNGKTKHSGENGEESDTDPLENAPPHLVILSCLSLVTASPTADSRAPLRQVPEQAGRGHGRGGTGPDCSRPLLRSNRCRPAPAPGWRRLLPGAESPG